MQLSFSHIMKHWKRNPNQQATKAAGSRNVLLRFYPPQSSLGKCFFFLFGFRFSSELPFETISKAIKQIAYFRALVHLELRRLQPIIWDPKSSDQSSGRKNCIATSPSKLCDLNTPLWGFAWYLVRVGPVLKLFCATDFDGGSALSKHLSSSQKEPKTFVDKLAPESWYIMKGWIGYS